MLQAKGDVQADFAWTCENFAQSCEMVQKVFQHVAAATHLRISQDRAKCEYLMHNGYFAD